LSCCYFEISHRFGLSAEAWQADFILLGMQRKEKKWNAHK
jgi:hypothetical protein